MGHGVSFNVPPVLSPTFVFFRSPSSLPFVTRVLGEVEESLTTTEIDEETDEEIVQVARNTYE